MASFLKRGKTNQMEPELTSEVPDGVVSEDTQGKASFLSGDIDLKALFGRKKTSGDEFTWVDGSLPALMFKPNYIRHRQSVKRATKRGLSVLLWGLLVIGLLSAGSFGLHFVSNQKLQEAELELTQKQGKLKELSVASAFFEGLTLRESSVKNTLVGEVDYSLVLGGVSNALPTGATLTGLTTKFGQPCFTPDPFLASEAVGCVEFSVSVRQLSDVAWFLETANKPNASAYVNSFLVSSTAVNSGDKGGYVLSGTANFTSKAFSYRFVDEDEGEDLEPLEGSVDLTNSEGQGDE